MSIEVQKDGYIWACPSDFISIGFQPGEKAATIVRVVCTLITVRYGKPSKHEHADNIIYTTSMHR